MFLLIVGAWEILEGYTRNFGAVGTRKKTRQGWEESVPRVYLHAFWLLNHLKALPFKRFKNCNKTKIILRKKISITQLPEYNGHITSHMRTFFVSGEVSQGEHLDEKGHPPLPEWASGSWCPLPAGSSSALWLWILRKWSRNTYRLFVVANSEVLSPVSRPNVSRTQDLFQFLRFIS